jgi:energy-coupling factor transporter ATP-binding protein EcfA2
MPRQVCEGEIVTILGANGAGKSTTLNAISGLVRASEGSVSFEGEPIHRLPAHKVVLTRMIDQCFRAHDNDRVADQVNHLLREYGVPDFFSRVERLLVQMFMGLGRYFPSVAVPRMVEKMRMSSARPLPHPTAAKIETPRSFVTKSGLCGPGGLPTIRTRTGRLPPTAIGRSGFGGNGCGMKMRTPYRCPF